VTATTIENLTLAPWERLVDETARAFAAFEIYRDLPVDERTVRRAAEISHERLKSKRKGSYDTRRRQFERWCGEHLWRARADEFDRFKARERVVAEIEAARDMGRRHAEGAMSFQTKALEALATLLPSEMSAMDILNFFEKAAKLERLARGEVDPHASTGAEGTAPQDQIRDLLSEDPALAKSAALFGAQILRANRERAEREGGDDG
jgi:hypothetical protein